MKSFLRLVLFTLLFAAPAAHAQAVDEDALLTDYIGLTKLLRTNGVDPVFIRWQEIESMCLPLQTPRSSMAYNRCRYAKAIDQALFADDSEACDNESIAIYPDGLKEFTTTAIIEKTGDKNSVTTITRPPSSVKDIRAMRRYAYDSCMSEKGWRNTRNYRFGQR